jgi:hypothetical protein
MVPKLRLIRKKKGELEDHGTQIFRNIDKLTYTVDKALGIFFGSVHFGI